MAPQWAADQEPVLQTAMPRRRALGLFGGALAGLGTGRRLAASGATVLFADDFAGGFAAEGANAPWFYFSVPGADGTPLFVGDDGTVTVGSAGLRVVAAGTSVMTGEPTFTKTVPQEGHGPAGVPGGVDHVKWLAYANHPSSSGVPGFDAVPGQELVGGSRMAGRTFGTAHHPFGDAVADSNDDLRLAAVALNTIDFESRMVFDLWLTNKRIYAFYERLPFGRGKLGNYTAFSFQIPLIERRPEDEHDLSIAYDRTAGTVRWLVDGEEQLRVDRIGRRIDRRYLTLDHGGVEEDVIPQQLDFGMGLFTLLDGRLPSGDALVRLSADRSVYFDPNLGEPTAQTFVDEGSSPDSRLFNQGAELQVRRFVVQSQWPNDRLT
jgi:hypothetical protein